VAELQLHSPVDNEYVVSLSMQFIDTLHRIVSNSSSVAFVHKNAEVTI